MTSRIILFQLKRVSTLRASIVPQAMNYAPKRTLLTKNFVWANRMKAQQATSLLGRQQGKPYLFGLIWQRASHLI